jgi:hypothetical protein
MRIVKEEVSLTPAEVEVLKTLLEFHWSNDGEGHGYYDEEAFRALVTKLFPEMAKPE